MFVAVCQMLVHPTGFAFTAISQATSWLIALAKKGNDHSVHTVRHLTLLVGLTSAV